MRRRKLLISIGALGTGGAAAFGTEAFTSIEAERSVDVAVAGDANAYLAIQPLGTDNSDRYVTTEDDGTVALNLDGSESGSGSGVSQDAVTQIEDLFKIVNQGSQATSVYFEDDSDAVTFRVTRSTNTSTNGTQGQSLEGPDNSVELAVGEQVVVGLTVDTLNYDVEGSLVDSATVYAEAGAAAPQQSIPDPQYVVDGTGDSPNTFATLDAAVAAAERGSVVGIEPGYTESPTQTVTVDTADLTITGYGEGAEPVIDDANGVSAIEVAADGVTLRDFTVEGIDDGSQPSQVLTVANTPSDLTVDGLTAKAGREIGGPVLDLDKYNSSGVGDGLTVTNCTIVDNSLGVSLTGSAVETATITNNTVDPGGDGIFVTDASGVDLTVEGNGVLDVGDDDGQLIASGNYGVKITSSTGSVNGQTTLEDQLDTLLVDNSVDIVQIDGSAGVTVDPDGDAYFSTDVQAAVDAAGQDGLVKIAAGSFEPTGTTAAAAIDLDNDGLTLRGAGREATVVDTSGFGATTDGGTYDPSIAPNDSIKARGNDLTIEDLTVVGMETDGFGYSDSSGFDPGPQGIKTITPPTTGLTIRNVRVEGSEDSEIQLSNVNDVLVENVVVDGTGDLNAHGAGIGIEDTTDAVESNIVLRDVRFVNNNYGGIAVFNSGSKYPVEGISLEGEMTFEFENFPKPALYVEDESAYSDPIVGNEISNPDGILTHRALLDDNEQSLVTDQEQSGTDRDRGSYRYFYPSRWQAVAHLNGTSNVGGPDASTSEVTIERL